MLVTAPGEVPGVERLLAAARPAGVVGVVHAVNDGVAEVTAGLEMRTLIGSDEFDERVLDLSLRALGGGFHADQYRDVRRAVRAPSIYAASASG